MDCRPAERGGRDSVEFTWQGWDEGELTVLGEIDHPPVGSLRSGEYAE